MIPKPDRTNSSKLIMNNNVFMLENSNNVKCNHFFPILADSFNNSTVANKKLAAAKWRCVLDNNGNDLFEMVQIEGFTCYKPYAILNLSQGETIDQLIFKAKEMCNIDPFLLGFSIPKTQTSDFIVILFSDDGYPLKRSLILDVFLKTSVTANVPTVNELKLSKIALHNRKYYFLGGCCHGDTISFDTSEFIDSFKDEFFENFRMDRILFFAGEFLLNGVQCIFKNYYNSSEISSSPLFFSTHDNPKPVEFILNYEDKITSIIVKYGNLVLLFLFI
jgi:hypothetical protein